MRYKNISLAFDRLVQLCQVPDHHGTVTLSGGTFIGCFPHKQVIHGQAGWTIQEIRPDQTGFRLIRIMSPPAPVGVRIWSDGKTKDSKQSLISSFVSFTTLTLYSGWLHVLFALFIGSFFSRLALAVLIAIVSTVFLPPRPILWYVMIALQRPFTLHRPSVKPVTTV